MAKQLRSIAVIVSSTRKPRVCNQVTDFVINTIKSQHEDAPLTIIDLADEALPFFDEPGIPQAILDPENYVHDHTKAWSREISGHDAFIFVTPQYNWGYPAVLKNAIDFLFNEWKGKTAMVVSYGGHGGAKSNAQLTQVLQAVRMTVVSTPVELTFASKAVTAKALAGEDLELNAESEESMWNADRKTILAAYGELIGTA